LYGTLSLGISGEANNFMGFSEAIIRNGKELEIVGEIGQGRSRNVVVSSCFQLGTTGPLPLQPWHTVKQATLKSN